MHRHRPLLAVLLAGLLAVPASAAPPDPLKYIPVTADFVLKVEKPRELAEAVVKYPALQEAAKLDGARDFLDSTGARRFFQLVAYYEKEFDAPWPELLDKLAGGGMALAVQGGGDNAPALLVVQGTDEKLMLRFTDVVLKLAAEELARTESKEKIDRGTYRDIDGVRIGGGFHAALTGSTLLIANKKEVLKHALDNHLDGGKSLADMKGPSEARKLVQKDALAWGWLNMAAVRKAPGAKDLYKLPRDDANLTILFGGLLDVAGRADFIAFGLSRTTGGFQATLRMPAGREGMNEAMALHAPLKGDQPGTLPNLEPKGVLFSQSFYLDLAAMWDMRAKLFNAQQVKGFDDFDKNGGRFTPGTSPGKLFQQTAPYHRVVVAHQEKLEYKESKPEQRFPAFAFVTSMRDTEFAGSMDGILRAAALLAGTQVDLKYHDEKVGDVRLSGWKFKEGGKFPNDRQGIRYNYSPCFAAVGDQFIFCSSLELGRQLIAEIEKQHKAGPAKELDPATSRMRFYAAGAADSLEATEEALITQTILSAGGGDREEAVKQVKSLLKWVRGLGAVQLETSYRADEFRVDLDLKAEKKD